MMIFPKRTEHQLFITYFLIAILFALATHHAWEDYYITYRSSKNLALGHGLVYTQGERVHSFTSPVNVLLPAGLIYLTGNISDDLVLWLYRLICAGLLGASAMLLFGLARQASLSKVATWFLLGIPATNVLVIDFTVNGQEVAFMIFFLAAMLHVLMVPQRSPVLKLGCIWAGLQWTRPDGFIYIGALAMSFLIFNKSVVFAASRRELFKIFLKAAAIAAGLYLPWIVWAWWYYGSPVPHTVIAKGLNFRPDHHIKLLGDFISFPFRALYKITSAGTAFLPIYAGLGGWPPGIYVVAVALGGVCSWFWILPSRFPAARAVSLAFLLLHFYITHIATGSAPWYIANTVVLAAVALTFFVQHGWEASRSPIPKMVLKAFVGFVLVLSTLILTASGYQLKRQQKLIEGLNRKPLGQWLAKNAPQTDTVFLEPLGYIGYYSGLKMLDYPGLSSPEVVRTRRELRTNDLGQILPRLKPDWIVRRYFELIDPNNHAAEYIMSDYELAYLSDVGVLVQKDPWLFGKPYLFYDSVYFVFHRKDSGTRVLNKKIIKYK